MLHIVLKFTYITKNFQYETVLQNNNKTQFCIETKITAGKEKEDQFTTTNATENLYTE